ncbi:MAG TPA: cytochrome P450 [Acidimicrobiia bacterium]|nr:cytochrome P450 [Acidimicrobiia bacterium]
MDAETLTGFDPFAEAVFADPAPWYALMRKEQPVFRVPGLGFYLVTRHEDVVAAVRDTDTFSNRFTSPGLALGRGSPAIQEELDAILAGGYPRTPTLLTNDPPAHTRFRRLVSRAFTPRRVASWSGAIDRLSDELIGAFAERGSVELVAEFAVPLPIGVIADALGVPRDMQPTFRRWTDDSTDLIGADVTDERRLEAARGLVEFQTYFAAELADRRRSPRDDFLTDLLQAGEPHVPPPTDSGDEDGLDDTPPLDTPEMLSILHQLLVAGNETTTTLLAESMRLLVASPSDYRRVAADGDGSYTAAVVEEALRLCAPAQGMFRVVTRDTVLGGVELPAGATAILMYASANRDESQWPDAESFCPGRDGVRHHLSFGSGIHFCVGAALSRAEAQAALPRHSRALPDARLATETLDYKPSFVLRGLRSLPLTFTRA